MTVDCQLLEVLVSTPGPSLPQTVSVSGTHCNSLNRLDCLFWNTKPTSMFWWLYWTKAYPNATLVIRRCHNFSGTRKLEVLNMSFCDLYNKVCQGREWNTGSDNLTRRYPRSPVTVPWSKQVVWTRLLVGQNGEVRSCHEVWRREIRRLVNISRILPLTPCWTSPCNLTRFVTSAQEALPAFPFP